MTNARRAIWLTIIGCLIGVMALIGGVLLTQDRTTVAAIVEPLRSQSMHDAAYANSANPRPVSDITCKTATTTTTTLPNITTFETTLMIANYTGLALAVGGRGLTNRPPEKLLPPG